MTFGSTTQPTLPVDPIATNVTKEAHDPLEIHVEEAKKKVVELETLLEQRQREINSLASEKKLRETELETTKKKLDSTNCENCFLILMAVVFGFILFGLLLAKESRDLDQKKIALLFKEFDWVRFESDTLAHLSNIPSYDMREVGFLNNLETHNNSVYDTTSKTSLGSWQVYQFLDRETRPITKDSLENKLKVWQRFVDIVEIDREKRLLNAIPSSDLSQLYFALLVACITAVFTCVIISLFCSVILLSVILRRFWDTSPLRR
jgi:hypothetical protein